MKLLKPQAGMTLIEIMVAVSILSVIMVSVVMLSNNMNKQLKDGELKADIQSLSRAIEQTIANKEKCSASFMGASSAVGARTMLTGLKSIDTEGRMEPIQSLAVRGIFAGDTTNRLTINGMYVEKLSQMGTGSNYELVVTFVKNPLALPLMNKTQSQAKMAGPNVVIKKFPLMLDDCRRSIVTAKAPLQPVCADPIGSVMTVTSNDPTLPGIEQWNVVVCRMCASREPVKGCL